MRVLFVVIFVCLTSCNNFYKVGNLVALEYPIETDLTQQIIIRYLDTLSRIETHAIPKKWLTYDKFVDTDSVSNKRIYFAEDPEEMYLLHFGGMPLLMDVFNPGIKKDNWVTDRSLVSKQEEERFMRRLKNDILDKIEVLAKRDGIPDSIIYK